jgi:TonB family protein
MLLIAGTLFAQMPVGIGAARAADEVSATPPQTEDITAYYPKAARLAGIEGTAALNCRMTEQYTLDACTVIRESPPGWGFGDAAIALAKQSKPKSYIVSPNSSGPVMFVFDLHPLGILPNILNSDKTYISPDYTARPDMNKLAKIVERHGSPGGRVVLDCIVRVDNKLNDCAVIDEPQLGSAIGKVAIEFAETFSMRSLTNDGTSFENAHVIIPFALNMKH